MLRKSRYCCQRADERLGEPPPRCNQEPSVVKNKDGRPRPPKDLLVMHCFGKCGGSALLGGLLGISRSMKYEFLTVFSYPIDFF